MSSASEGYGGKKWKSGGFKKDESGDEYVGMRYFGIRRKGE